MFKCVRTIYGEYMSHTLLAIKVKINSAAWEREGEETEREFDRPWWHARVFFAYTRVIGINSYNLNLTH